MPERPGFLNIDDYLAYPRAPSTWIIQDLLPVSGKALLYSAPKTGKSALALQLADNIAEGGEWMTFPIVSPGRVLYFQLDNPGTTWSKRVRVLRNNGLCLDNNKVFMADASTIPMNPFDILQPGHRDYLQSIVRPLAPQLVIVDTLRKVHSGDENSSTVMSNVMTNLYSAVFPAALLVVSHDKKPSPDMEKDIIYDHRGSGGVVGEVDCILRMTKTRLYYAGRDVEADNIKLKKHVLYDGDERTILWEPDPDEYMKEIAIVIADHALASVRSKARALADMTGKSFDTMHGRLRSYLRRANLVLPEDGPQEAVQ